MHAIQAALDNLTNRHFSSRTPGAALLVARKDEVFMSGAGLANLATGAPITADTTFRLASVSKQFTAMCLLLLAQRQQLHLNDNLNLYFPELTQFKSIQLLHLLNHTSGLPDFEEHICGHQTEQLTDEDVLAITAAQQEPLFAPGTLYRYSNTAYVLLGLLVERVSGTNYADFLEEHIFAPLHMKHSVLYKATGTIPHRALGYRQSPSEGQFILTDQNIGTATRGDGCIYMSVQDYLKWHKALSDAKLFNINKPLKTYKATIDEANGWHYNMGWFLAEVSHGNSEFFHSGDTSGFTNLVIRLPHLDALIVCFCNTANNQPFLTELLQELKKFPELCPTSDLVYKLPELTR
ncbi:serine hydrolase domain-containing protein [uncultured Pontibacter sp.]|uniref:serine hydrolase domain-containing protein n=1 Tax=uncultured Pontibacter sp. TaxID=453356 RepID=UPI00260A156F|nr:serine hydrolase domain-containing protein [uncultured Pontibacter sp.]